MKWTAAQLQAIEAPIQNILINAGAGSGKTAVLTERILHRLQSGVSLDQLLVVTFTRKAALEMKERLRHKLEEASVEFPELVHQLELLDAALITTIDGFASSIVTQFGYLEELPSSTTIIDNVMLVQQKSRILEQLMESWYQEQRPDFIKYITTFTIKNDRMVFAQILALDEIIRSYNNQYELFTHLEEHFHSEDFKRSIHDGYVGLLREKIGVIQESQKSFEAVPPTETYNDYLDQYNDHLRIILDCPDYDSLYNNIDEYRAAKTPRLSKPRWIKSLNPEMDSSLSEQLFIEGEINEEEYQEFLAYIAIDDSRKQLKKDITSLTDDVSKPWSQLMEEYDAILEYQTILVDLTLIFHEKVNEYYRSSGLMDFSSMANTALALVTNHQQVQQELVSRFVEIYVDEYQDTSPFQDKLITSISNNNLFVVGDIKQSIYGFRQADPRLFLQKQEAFQNDPNGLVINMNNNFRSRPEVIEGINRFFSMVMSKALGGVDYDQSQALVAGREFDDVSSQEKGLVFLKREIPNEASNDLALLIGFDDEVEVDVDGYPNLLSNESMAMVPYEGFDEDESDISSYDGELADDYIPGYLSDTTFKITFEHDILVVIQDIKHKMDSGFLIQGEEGLRPVKYDDFVILMDRRRYFRPFQLLFDYHDVPVYIHTSEPFITTADIQALKNLFRLIYSFHDDRYFIKTFKHLYASVARSYIVDISDDEIHRYLMALRNERTTSIDDVIRLAPNDSKVFLLEAKRLARLIDQSPLIDLVQEVFDRFDIFNKALSLYDYERVEKRLFFMLQKASEFMKTGLQLNEFIDYFDFLNRKDQSELDIDFFETTQIEPGKVNIMTIHASKGLEFPIVYYPNLELNFATMQKGVVDFSHQTGLISPGFQEGIYYPITSKVYYAKQRDNEISERLRLLYVALTRAKELAIVFPATQEEKRKPLSLTSDGSVVSSSIYNMSSFFSIFDIEEVFGPVQSETLIDKYLEDYRIPKAQEKLTLSNDQLELQMISLDLPTPVPRKARTGSTQISELLTPDQLSAVDYGNHLHELLSFIDFTAPIDPQLDRLKVSEKDANHIRRFMESELMNDVSSATVYHEYRFHDETEDGPINGIIDLLVVYSDHCKIIDFKLKDIHKTHYQEQVGVYITYISKLIDLPVHGYLYSMITGDIDEIK